MNIIKARTKNGTDVLLRVQQHPTPTWLGKDGRTHGGDWSSAPAAVKAHATRIMGLILTGKRQAQS